MSQLQRSLSFIKKSEAKKGDRLFIFDSFASLQRYTAEIISRLRTMEVEHSVFGNACINLPEGNRLILVVRHSPEWVNFIQGMTYVDWFSNVDLPENELVKLQMRIR